MKDLSLIIICGGRRTGTTLLNAILASAPKVNPLGQEAQIVTRLIEAYQWSKINYKNFGESFFESFESLSELLQKNCVGLNLSNGKFRI